MMGPQYANRLGDLLEDVWNGNQVVATKASHIMEDSTKPRRGSTIAAWVNVIYGSNEYILRRDSLLDDMPKQTIMLFLATPLKFTRYLL